MNKSEMMKMLTNNGISFTDSEKKIAKDIFEKLINLENIN